MKFNETKSQERLINLMLQAGVEWPSNYFTHAAQDSVGEVWGYLSKPSRKCGDWGGSVATDSCLCIVEKIPNWHQTIVTREQYEARDGWITWHGGDRPIDCRCDIKWRHGDIDTGVDPGNFLWRVDRGITAYRIHKPSADEPCESVKACIPDQQTIEQLIAEWKRKLEVADVSRERAEKDMALADEAAQAVEEALTKAGWN